MRRVCIYIFCVLHYLAHTQSPFTRAHQLILQGSYAEVSVVMDSCEAKNYYKDSALFYKGLAAVKGGNIDLCHNYTRRLIKEFPTFYEVHFLKGLVHFQNQNYGKSANEFTKLIQINSKDLKALFNRSVALGLMEDYLDAIEDLNTCIAINPDYADAYYSRAYWYEYTGNYQEAIKDYQNVIRLIKKNYDAYFGLAFIYQTLKENDKACETINKAISAGSQIAEEIKESFCK